MILVTSKLLKLDTLIKNTKYLLTLQLSNTGDGIIRVYFTLPVTTIQSTDVHVCTYTFLTYTQNVNILYISN